MKHNSTGAQMVITQTGAPVTALRTGRNGKQGDFMLSESSREINASSQKDLMVQIGKLLQMANAGQISAADPMMSLSAAERAEIVAGNREIISEALADHTGAAWASLGSSIVATVEERGDRTGFLRRLAMPANVKQGETPRVELRHHVNHCIVATGPTDLGYRLLRGRVYNADEFEMKSSIRVSAIDLAQINGDLLDRAQKDCFDSLIVEEDRMLKRMWDQTVGLENDLTYIKGDFTPRYLSVLRNTVGDWNLPVSTAVIASDYWTDIIGNSEWSGALDPVSKYDLLFSGRLSTMQGLEILTDGFRPAEQRVLEKGEIYVVADAEYHAVYSNRGGATAQPTSGAYDGNTDKGWLVSQLFSLTLPNARTVAKAKRSR